MMHTISKKIMILFLALTLSVIAPQPSYANNNASSGVQAFADFMIKEVLSFVTSLFSKCHEVPTFNGFKSGSVSLSVADGGSAWISTGANVTGNQAMQIDWTTQGIMANVRKYMVMYRVDPRFIVPQIFILTYNYNTGSYDSDYHKYNNGSLISDQLLDFTGNNFFSIISDYNNYFNFVNRDTIELGVGDVINIALVDMAAFTGAGSKFKAELGSGVGGLMSMYSATNLPDNQIMYLDATTWCTGNLPAVNSIYVCNSNGASPPVYTYNSTQYIHRAVGLLDIDPVKVPTLPVCPAGATGSSFNHPCLYDLGRTMTISNGAGVIKDAYVPFTYSNASGNSFFQARSVANGSLNFSLVDKGPYYVNEDQHMTDWGKHGSLAAMQGLFADAINGASNKLYGGRYIMDILVGNGNVGDFAQQNAISVEYKIVPRGVIPTGRGTSVVQNYSDNAPSDGVLWLRVVNPNSEVVGAINVGYSYYDGTTFLSDILYNGVVLPVQNVIRKTAALFYSALATNPTFQWIIRLLLTFYIIHNALYFLAGMREVTMNSLLHDVIKITVVLAVLTDTSWEFFYNHVFRIFLEGMGYLFSHVIGLTSNVNNPFGFVDVIFEKYFDGELWILLLAMLLSVTNGLTILALVVIVAILSFVVITLDIVVAYVFAYVAIAVLISIAPLFIICILFERTKGIFDSWMSLMFNYMIQPTILLIFFLLLDQLMTNQLSLALTKACWGYLIRFAIHLDMNWAGLGVWTFSIPFLAGIPGLIPQVQTSFIPGPTTQSAGTFMGMLSGALMFYLYTNIAEGLKGYVAKVVMALTGASGGGGGDIAGQIKGAVGKVAGAAAAPVKAAASDIKGKMDGKIAKESPKMRSGSDSKSEAGKSGSQKSDSGGGGALKSPSTGSASSQSVTSGK